MKIIDKIIGLLPDARFSIQHGWLQPAEDIAKHQALLALANNGGHQHMLVDGNRLQTVQTLGWYQANNVTPHVMCYDTSKGDFPNPSLAAAWVKSHRGMTWIIGNEPDCGTPCGFEYMGAEPFATFYYKAARLILSNDRSANIVSGAWAGGICDNAAYTEENFLTAFYNRYGALPASSMGLHVYQNTYPSNPYPLNRVNTFLSKVKEWKAKGWITTDKVTITEFSWSGNVLNYSEQDVITFAEWFIPELKRLPRLLRWHWWQWATGTILVSGNTLTPIGEKYKALARKQAN